MKSNYKRLGDYVQEVNIRNKDLIQAPLMGVSIKKVLMPSIANIIGTDMSTYKLIKKNQFAYGSVTSRNGDKISIALLEEHDNAMVSQAYTVFEAIDEKELLPEYLMMWFRRPEFDRYARFMSHGSAREIFSWTEMRDTLLPIPSPEKQLEIVKEYNTIQNRIQLNNQLITKLEETAQAIYKQWFVDFEFPFDFAQGRPDADGKSYKSNGGEMVFCEELEKEIPVGWEFGDLGSIIEPINGYAFKSEDFSLNGIYPIIKIKNIKAPYAYIQSDTQYYNSKLSSNLQKVVIQKGDVLISMTGSGANQLNSAVGQVGKYYYNSISLLNQRVCKLRPKEDYFKELMFQFISSKEIQTELLNGSTGSANQANISPNQIRELKLLIPNENLMRKFESIASSINNFKSLEMIDKLEELKDLLLARMTKVESRMETV
ncbi:restriction endonuclease subunit S [Flavobacterium sp. PL12]|uniref:restriction endonuclease subunit S n=1 Tax=Flavobacterium sp. PL12 TaxID=3071718 RepID=UPI00319E6745